MYPKTSIYRNFQFFLYVSCIPCELIMWRGRVFYTIKYDKSVQSRIQNPIQVFFSFNKIKEITGKLMTGEYIFWPLASWFMAHGGLGSGWYLLGPPVTSLSVLPSLGRTVETAVRQSLFYIQEIQFVKSLLSSKILELYSIQNILFSSPWAKRS